MTLYVFAYFVRVIISKSIGMQPALISKALGTVRISGRKTKSSLVNLITTFFALAAAIRVSVKPMIHSGFTANMEGFRSN